MPESILNQGCIPDSKSPPEFGGLDVVGKRIERQLERE
jgi:hypothetical protein